MRVDRVRFVGGTGVSPVQWRRNETRLAYVLADGAVWQTQTNVTSCSDAAIAPLVTSQLLQLTALTVATLARTRTTDIRGNVTESWTEQADGITTTKRRVPEATNIISSRSRFGVALESVSVSAVTNTTVYDALGRVSASIDGRGNVTRTEYDSFGRRSATIDAAGNPTRYAYDRFGNLAAVTNALGNAIVYEYDLRGRKTYEGGATYPVRYTYDVFGNKTTMMTYRDESRGPDSGDVTTWLYDEASGVMTNKVYADGKGPRYDYDANGRLVKRTWARGIDTFYVYDGWGNLTNTTYTDNTPTVTLWYDALGRQIEAHDAAGVTTFAYDAFGANTNETVVGVAGTNVLERFADAYGRDAGYALNGERQTTISYDHYGRISTMTTATRGGGVSPAQNESDQNHCSPSSSTFTSFQWSYLQGSDLKSSLTYPNGLTASWTYDANNQLLQVRNATPTNVISQYDYTYDAAGHRIQIAKSGGAFEIDDVVSYGYNARSELTNAVAAVDANYHYSYQYDSIGNRESSSERGMNTTYVANELNQYSQIATANEDAFIPEFDDDGNQTLVKTATGVWRVTYNGENRPILWVRDSDNTTLAMSYDHMGRRRVKNGQRFFYDGYLQVYNIYSPASTHNSNCYMWDPTEPVATRPLYWQPRASGGNVSLFYDHDGNKSVSDILGMNGGVAAHYDYAPFGAVMAQLGTFAAGNSWRFSSEYADEMSGTTYFNYRHYVPREGRLLSRDYMEEEQSYLYIENAPLNSEDRLGLTKCSKWDEKTIGISAHGSIYGGEGAFDGRAKKSSPKNWHPVDTGAKLFDVLRSNSSKDGPCCSCVKNLQIHSHANGSGISMRWDSGMFVQKPEKISDKQGLSDEQRGVPGAARDVMDLKREIEKENIIFCKSCKIVLYGCWTGQDDMLAQELSKVVKCSVIAPMGPASAANKKGKRIASPGDGTETRGFCADGWAEWRNGKKTSASSPIYGE